MIGKVKFEVSEDGMVLSGKNKDVKEVFHFLVRCCGSMRLIDYYKQALQYKKTENQVDKI